MPLMRHSAFPGQVSNVAEGAVSHLKELGWREVKPKDEGAERAEEAAASAPAKDEAAPAKP